MKPKNKAGRKPTDLTGRTFGRLTIVREAPKVVFPSASYGRRMWRCKCECGKKVTVHDTNLRTGRTKSCGCLQRELVRKRPPSFYPLGPLQKDLIKQLRHFPNIKWMSPIMRNKPILDSLVRRGLAIGQNGRYRLSAKGAKS